MQTKLLFIGLLFCAAANAQPVVQANMPASGTQFQMYTSTSASAITHTGPGASQSWNFSTAATSPLLTQTYKAASQVAQQIQDSFPGATHAIEQAIGSAVVSTEMYQLSSSAWLWMGAKNSGSSWTINSTPYARFKYPMNFGDVVTVNSRTLNYDAYGTLQTPFGSYSNVVRIKITETGTPDTLVYYSQFTPSYQTLSHYVVENGTGTIKNIFFYKPLSSGTGVQQPAFENNTMLIYPNPAAAGNIIHVKHKGNEPVTVYSVSGKKMLDILNGEVIPAAVLSPGIYLVQCGSTVKKLVVN